MENQQEEYFFPEITENELFVFMDRMSNDGSLFRNVPNDQIDFSGNFPSIKKQKNEP